MPVRNSFVTHMYTCRTNCQTIFLSDNLLSSPYGEKFSEADAKWAVARSGADWNAQAVMSATSYMEMGGFSRAKLIGQLALRWSGRRGERGVRRIRGWR